MTLIITAIVVEEDEIHYIPSSLVGGKAMVFLHICDMERCEEHDMEIKSLERIMERNVPGGDIVEFLRIE